MGPAVAGGNLVDGSQQPLQFLLVEKILENDEPLFREISFLLLAHCYGHICSWVGRKFQPILMILNSIFPHNIQRFPTPPELL